MGRGRKGLGVQVRMADYRIRFTWRGHRYEEPYDLKPSAAHTAHVKRLARDLKAEIDVGTFDEARFAHYFPDSKNAVKAPIDEPTFGEMAAAWRKTRGSELAAWTRRKDELYVRFWNEKVGAETPMRSLKPSKVEAIVGSHAWPSAKHRNNLLAALRGIFALWTVDHPHERIDPTARIKNATVQLAPPDPFDLDEVELILADMAKHYDPRVVAYYEFAFFSGVRPEEEIALRWPKIDARKRLARIAVARTAHGEEKAVKTHVARDVELNSRAWAALERMRPYTSLKAEEGGAHVFENPRTGKPWASEADQRDLYWTPTLKRLRLRHRVAYQTRATRATAMLMAGMNPAYCAKQLGHSKRVFFDRYADWIDRAERANERERAKDEAHITTTKEHAA